MDKSDICWIQGMLCLIAAHTIDNPPLQIAFAIGAVLLLAVGLIHFFLECIRAYEKKTNEKGRDTGGPR